MAELYTQNPGVGTQNQQLLDTQRLAQGMRGSAATVPEAQQQLAQAEAANTMAQLSAPSVFSEARRQYGTDAQIPQSAQAAGNLADMFRMYVADVNAARAGAAPSQGFTPAPPPGFEGARMPTEYRPMLTEQTLASPAQGFYNPAESARYFGSALGQYRDISSALAGITGFNREELARQLQGTERSISAILGATSAQEERARRQLETILDVEARAREQQIAQQNAKAAFLNAISSAVTAGSIDTDQAAQVLRSLNIISGPITSAETPTAPTPAEIITGDPAKDAKIFQRDSYLKKWNSAPVGSARRRNLEKEYQDISGGLELNPTPDRVKGEISLLRSINRAETLLQDSEVKRILKSDFQRNRQGLSLSNPITRQTVNPKLRELDGILNTISSEQVQRNLGEFTVSRAAALTGAAPSVLDTPEQINGLLGQLKTAVVLGVRDTAQANAFRDTKSTGWIPPELMQYFRDEQRVENVNPSLNQPLSQLGVNPTALTGKEATPPAATGREYLRQRALEAVRKGQQ